MSSWGHDMNVDMVAHKSRIHCGSDGRQVGMR